VRVRRDVKIERISRVPLFAHCSKRELAAIAQAADEVSVDAGRELTREGASGREFVVIVDGAAEVRRRGRKVNELGPGEFLGEISLITRIPRTATVTTTAPSTLLVLTDGAFRELLRLHPAIQGKVLTSLAERLAPEAV
jgi:CRP-like cAMP-binding protein